MCNLSAYGSKAADTRITEEGKNIFDAARLFSVFADGPENIGIYKSEVNRIGVKAVRDIISVINTQSSSWCRRILISTLAPITMQGIMSYRWSCRER